MQQRWQRNLIARLGPSSNLDMACQATFLRRVLGQEVLLLRHEAATSSMH